MARTINTDASARTNAPDLLWGQEDAIPGMADNDQVAPDPSGGDLLLQENASVGHRRDSAADFQDMGQTTETLDAVKASVTVKPENSEEKRAAEYRRKSSAADLYDLKNILVEAHDMQADVMIDIQGKGEEASDLRIDLERQNSRRMMRRGTSSTSNYVNTLEDDAIVDVASSARMSGEPGTTLGARSIIHSAARASRESPTGEQDRTYRPKKHGMVYVSTFKSQPSFGFGRAKRACCEKEKSWPKDEQEAAHRTSRTQSKVSHSSLPGKGELSQTFSAVKGDDAFASMVKRPASKGDFRGDGARPESGRRGSFVSMRSSHQNLVSSHERPESRASAHDKFGVDAPLRDIRGMSAEGGILDKRNVFRGKSTFGNAKQRVDLVSDGPGPATASRAVKKVMHGGKFNVSKSKSELDRMIARAKELPGPASYETSISKRVSGGRFNMSKPMTELDLIARRAKLLPGPANYSTNEPWGFTMNSKVPGGNPLPRGGRVMFGQHASGFGRHGGIGQWVIRHLAEDALYATPGPGYYHQDW